MNLTMRLLGLLRALSRFGRVAACQVLGPSNRSNVRAKNFGQMDERFYRGARPRKNDYKGLAALGINTVIDLREKPNGYERLQVEANGMRYINIAMNDTDYPRSEQIDAFLSLVNEPTAGKFFVHCAGGRHRTGVIGAVYRFTVNHWSYDRVYREMKSYDFYTRWGHGALKTFVQDYSRQFQAKRPGGSVIEL